MADVPWPPASLVIAIRRGEKAFVPTGQTQLQQGDRLTVLVRADHAGDLADALGVEGVGSTGAGSPPPSRP